MQAVRTGASRRDVLALLGAIGIGAGFGGSLIGAATTAHAQTPKKGGKIRVAGFGTSTADTLDPAKQSYSTDYCRCSMFYNGLVDLDATLTPQMSLAESMTSDKATVWTIKLRKGVQFHDGKEFKAEDVVFSLQRHLDPATGSRARALAAQMKEIVASGTHEVTITLTGPNADFPVVLGTHHFLIAAAGTTDFTKGIGTGPYKCKEFTPGVRSIAVRNENYWKQGGGPYVDEIEFFGIPDVGARVNALMAGDVHLIGNVNPASARLVLARNDLAIMETKSGNYTNLVMRLDQSPGNNADFVLGMKLLMNRNVIRRNVFQNYAEVANDQPIPPMNRYHAKDIPQRPFDPEKAKFHLNKAGAIGSTIPVVTSVAATGSVEMGLLLQQAAQAIGVKIDLKQVPADGYWSNFWMKVPVGYGNINPRPSADVLFSLFFASTAAWNESGWKNEKFDQLLLAARAETDGAKRKQMYTDMQVMVHESSGIGIPVFISGLDAHSAKLKGLTPMGTGSLMGFAFAEHVWLDA
ncbi:MAG: ABC transporter substrate-binding protein [Phreatobacter sp.]|nr:ABC transporter substrate-binding protein [Phreatobacter sp.]MDP2803061.1 ABC transporter substrate-binding protein [Phreatobacter sp.]